MASFREGLRSGLRSGFCRGLNQDPQFISNLEDAFRGTLFEFSGDRLNQIFCDRPSGEFDPEVEFPVSGGQCSGVNYSVVIELNRADNGLPADPIDLGVQPGPITFDTPDQPPVNCTNPGLPANNYYRFKNGQGTSIFQSNSCSAFAQNPRAVATPVSAEPPGGCGDAPPNLPPPGPTTIDIDIEYGDNNEFSLTVPVIFAPIYASFDGTLNIPFTIEDLDLIGEVALNGDFEVTFDFGGNRSPNSGDDGPIGDPDPEGGDPDDEPENDLGLIAGVFVVVTRLPTERATFIPQSAGPSIVAPRAGSVKFKVSADGRSGWTEDFPVKSSNAWIPVPGRLLASDVQVTPDFGAELSFRAVRVRPEPT